MPQVQIRQFPGFGIVYPDGVSGIKIVRTFTEAPKKIINPDGSISYTTPSPTIHELFGGGFAYADGSPVNDRRHLEGLPSKMREMALSWFDSHGEISAESKTGIPKLDLDEKKRPEPDYILSSDLPAEKDEVRKDLDEQLKKEKIQSSSDVLSNIVSSIKNLVEVVEKQGQEIAKLKKRPHPISGYKGDHTKHAEMMREKWKNPEYRAKMASKKKRSVLNGNDTA